MEWMTFEGLFNIDGCEESLTVVTVIGDEIDESVLERLRTFTSDTELHGCETAVFDFECEELYGKLWGFGWIRARENGIYKRIHLHDAQSTTKKVANDPLEKAEKIFSDRRGPEIELE